MLTLLRITAVAFAAGLVIGALAPVDMKLAIAVPAILVGLWLVVWQVYRPTTSAPPADPPA